MADVSPTPLTRRTSQRQMLRRQTSRSTLSRSDSTPVQHSRAMSTSPIQQQHQQSPQKQQLHQLQQQHRPRHYSAGAMTNGADSSDDEDFVPMKLSALTKALLGDKASGAGMVDSVESFERIERAPSPLRMRRRSALSSTSTSTASLSDDRMRRRSGSVASRGRRETDQRDATTATAVASVSSRPTSPARSIKSVRSRDDSPARKRVVRLSNTTQIPQSLDPIKRRSTSGSRSNSNSTTQSNSYHRPESRGADRYERERGRREGSHGPNTPPPAPQGKRVVRITTGSSGQKPRSDSGSRHASDRSRLDLGPDQHQYQYQHHYDHYDHYDHDQADDGANGYTHHTAAGMASVSRFGSRVRADADTSALQGATGIKRVGGRLTGTFLSGPARRGRRRQSEEDGLGEQNEQIEQSEQHGAGNEPDVQGHHDPYRRHSGLDGQSSFYGDPRRDFASGSPPSRAPSRHQYTRSSSRMESSSRTSLPPREYAADPREQSELHYRLPPSRPGTRTSMRQHGDQDHDHGRNHDRGQYDAVDQENHDAPPAPTYRRASRTPAELVLEMATSRQAPPTAPTAAAAAAVTFSTPAPRDVSPDRRPLGPMSQNTPQRPAPAPPTKPSSVLERVTRVAKPTPAPTAPSTSQVKRRNLVKFNGKYYTRLDCLGKGGSAKVYRVTSDNGDMFALKRVSLEHADELMIRGYKGEIDLLKKLGSVKRVIHLEDYELNEEKQVLSVLMEMGELDLETLMGGPRPNIADMRFDPVFVRHYWKEMVECVHAVHQHDVVHSDLKPANFVLVKGRLKLIDFGIANAIQTDETVNVHRETQVGTPNYMSPESLLDSNAAHGRVPGKPKLMKLGKPSDVWSLGCILYRMVYGMAPFQHIANPMARCQAIINWDYDISFPAHGMGGVAVPPSLLRLMRRCLNREHHLRPTCEEMLHPTDPFLYPVEMASSSSAAAAAAAATAAAAAAAALDGSNGVLPIDQDMLARIIQNVVQRCRSRVPSDAEALSVWPDAYWSSVKKAMSSGRDGSLAGRSA